MRWLSLFSGVGGFDLALQRKGHEIVGACEIDDHARRIYAKHFPGVPIHENATTLQPEVKLSAIEQKRKDLSYCYLRTLRDSSTTMEGEPLPKFSQRWMNSGTMQNGRCSIANTLFRRTGNVSSLLDILEENPDPKYFLSEEMVEKLTASSRSEM